MLLPFSSGRAAYINKTVFNAGGGVSWQVWNKPEGCTMAMIWTVGAGGGGGGGGTSHTTGGGSGAPGGIANILVPIELIADVMYVQVGLGGAGGIAAGNGTAGGNTFVSWYPTTNNQDCLTTAKGGGAGGGAAASAGTAGVPASGFGTTMWSMVFLSTPTSDAGALGGSAAVGTSVSMLVNTFLTGGGGGGGGANAGGSITNASSSILTSTNLVVGGAGGASPGAGGNGYSTIQILNSSPYQPVPAGTVPFLSFGGGGGGGTATAATAGGQGGNGGPAAGGGGGGGSSSSTGGAGGRGGDGWCIIWCW